MKFVKRGVYVMLVVLVASTFVFAVQQKEEKEEVPELTVVEPVKEKTNVKALAIPDNLTFAGEAVPVDDPEIKERMDRELLVNTYWQSNALLLMKRASKFFPIIEPILKKNNIPDDFKYLAIAESGLQQVVSHAGATGFWQIMRQTGKEYGLEINKNVDERYHIEKATEVACRYLKASKKRFGNWTLVAASYNAGVYGVSKRLKAQKVNDYYNLLLGEETGRYVFRIIAIKEILSNPKKYGFAIESKDLYDPVPCFEVEVNKAVVNFADFANKHEINYKILKMHNPWLREPHLNNASGKKYMIKIPNKGYYTTLN